MCAYTCMQFLSWFLVCCLTQNFACLNYILQLQNPGDCWTFWKLCQQLRSLKLIKFPSMFWKLIVRSVQWRICFPFMFLVVIQPVVRSESFEWKSKIITVVTNHTPILGLCPDKRRYEAWCLKDYFWQNTASASKNRCLVLWVCWMSVLFWEEFQAPKWKREQTAVHMHTKTGNLLVDAEFISALWGKARTFLLILPHLCALTAGSCLFTESLL